MTLHRMVDGKKVFLTPEEEVEVRAAWARADIEMVQAEQARVLAEKKAAALKALQDKLLAEAILDPMALQEVKDYAAMLETQ